MPARLSLNLTPALAMTASIIQSLDVLQLPQAELSAWLLNELEKNPLLEAVGPTSHSFIQTEKEVEARVSLYEHLRGQIREAFSDPEERKMAEELLHSLDDRGYLELSPLKNYEKVLSILQTFDPPGIFARNLQECLLLQLKAQNLTDSPVYVLVRDFFSDLLEKRFGQIQKKLDLSDAIQKLRQLSFRPASLFQTEIAPTIIPDLLIDYIEGKWKIEIPDHFLPQFRIISFELESFDKEEKSSMRQWRAGAKWISHCVNRRKKVLLEIGAYLVQKQSDYLLSEGELTPLSVREAADFLKMHESTLSRALSGKYAETPRGIIPLRLLLNKADGHSAKELIKRLCEKEGKALTDEEISEHLAKKGISLARRTISKYRKALKIGSARSRPYFSRRAAPKSQQESALDKEAQSLE